jgi:signal transduction histidine kinase
MPSKKKPVDLSVQILIQIRDRLESLERSTNDRFGDVTSAIERTNERLDQTNGRLEEIRRLQVESETRVATVLVAVDQSLGWAG